MNGLLAEAKTIGLTPHYIAEMAPTSVSETGSDRHGGHGSLNCSADYSQKKSPFGMKYVVSGKISAPGAEANVTTVWLVESADGAPRLVTAYPGEKA